MVDGLDLTLRPATVTWIAGRNGVGKTTLLRLVVGVIAPDRGAITLDGLHPERDRREYQRRVGFLPAGNGGLYARLTVRQHLEYWSRLALVARRSRRSVIDRAIRRFSLDETIDARADRLSMGQRQRVRIAMAFIHSPRVVLLDEPHTSLDEEGMAIVSSALDELKASGGAAVCCSPRGDVDIEIDDRFVMEAGRLERD